ncbi:colicin immunity domain-containing protein [Halovivax cerinus]|uniref:Colicin immunity domain-containing protein n=1 Tax=Halovivax cerinus TaxID=1487865 RepID=A0ABD5NTA8_9EURY|nr:colicin immunity domain-containing protein [Halovivax cerinus]
MSETELTRTYLELIRKFTGGEMTAPEFERQYLDEFKSDRGNFPSGDAFDPYHRLFVAVDAYCSDPELRDEYDIDETALRETAVETKAQLEHRLETITG